jgi:hypothetical protein
VAGGTSVNTSFITVGNPLVMTLSAQYAAQPGHEVDADLLDVARSVHEEFDTRVEPTVVEDCLREVASRFDGARQGLAVWVIGLAVVIALAAAGTLFGAKYNVLAQLDLPRIPVDEGTATTGAIVALTAIMVVSAVAAVAGGKTGERYHRRIDRAPFTG